MRIIAGLEYPDAGRVILSGEDITDKEPYLRNVNMVFQNYALFPHMTVADNIAYGLKLKKVDKVQRRQRVEEMLSLVQLEGLEAAHLINFRVVRNSVLQLRGRL